MAKCFLYADQESSCSAATEKFDAPAVERTREFPSVNYERQGAARELERVGGLSRYELVRQFRRRCGTSPYHYSVMRRLDRSRRLIRQNESLAATAADCGFADRRTSAVPSRWDMASLQVNIVTPSVSQLIITLRFANSLLTTHCL